MAFHFDWLKVFSKMRWYAREEIWGDESHAAAEDDQLYIAEV